MSQADADAIAAYRDALNEFLEFADSNSKSDQFDGSTVLARSKPIIDKLKTAREGALVAGRFALGDFRSMQAMLQNAAGSITQYIYACTSNPSVIPSVALLAQELLQIILDLDDLISIAKESQPANQGAASAPIGTPRNKERDDEVKRLKREKPNLTAGQIAKLICQNPEWAKMQNGKEFGAGSVRAILSRDRRRLGVKKNPS